MEYYANHFIYDFQHLVSRYQGGCTVLIRILYQIDTGIIYCGLVAFKIIEGLFAIQAFIQSLTGS
jgi:hypothetical protein